MTKIKEINYESIIIFLFSILPVIDSINGYMIKEGIGSIGKVYKMLLIAILLFMALYRTRVTLKTIKVAAIAIGYIIAVTGLNLLILDKPLIASDFPIKLILNILDYIINIV